MASSLPPPPLDASEGPERCRHTWGDPVAVSFSCDSRDVIRVCEPCQGFVRRCKRCRRFHLVYQGQGGEYSMPWWVCDGSRFLYASPAKRTASTRLSMAY